ncbi:glycosyltransferase family 2 protein [Dermacoccus nishinomiyaensis]|uniref:glycosyltransferase family 2 protein n=1 Tax=Dermacoccus TaxID=57495 RepID=UPI000785D64F|nr:MULTISPECIES: glycosyltransferase family 2 protein [Dermacoccus]QQY24147.1 glycosyltransferase family 2 protein [Dermacoccus nishinomiyaensis]STD71198.1 Chondroitin polymerase [Dermacoccus nishinomiyaensis]
MGPLVSAIVPFYNVEEFLDGCLASITAQTYPNFECILVDDGSPDGSRAVAERWASRDERLRIVTQENQGLGAARNTGTAHSHGDYLIFLDSDDLLAPRAFEQFVTSLEASGSDFAAAHVWRLPLTRPVEPSWAHSEPFAQRRMRTSIREVPLLMRDRMAWNKMWRRSFWEEGGYAWPEMKFEDFPVSMRAHLEATAVDTLSDPVYVWRERPVGQSISGQGKALDNVQDRVRAAIMVLDTVDASGSPELRELVHSHLVDVDLREVMGSMTSGHADDQPTIEALAHELAQRIDPARIVLAAPDLQKAYRAARENDIELLRSLATARQASSPQRSTLDRARRAPKALVRRATTMAEQVSSPRPRTATLVEADFGDELITHRIRIKLDERLKRRATVTAKIGEKEMKVITAITSEGLICDLEIEPLTVARHGGFNPVTLAVEAGPVHFEGHVVAPSDLLGGFHRAGYRLQGLNRGGRYGIERKRDADLVTDLVLDGETLHVHVNRQQGELVVEQPWPTTQRTYPIIDGVANVPLAELVAADPADNPVTNVASRRLSVTDGVTTMPLLLACDGVRAPIAGRDVEVRRADDASAFLVHRPA